MTRKKVAVIGGGIQGISLAYFLSKNPDLQVTLYEKSSRLGGLLGLLKIGGTHLEGFYHHLSNHDSDILDLIRELGLADRLIYAKSKVGIFYDGKTHPFSTPGDLLAFAPLNLWERIRLGIATLWIRSIRNWQKLRPKKASVWLKKICGEKAYRVVWEPLLEGKFGNKKNEISMAWMWDRIAWRAKSRSGREEQLVYPKGGFGLIVEEMIKRIVSAGGLIRTGTGVDRIGRSGEAITITANGSAESFDLAFVTTPIRRFLESVPDLPEEYREKLSGIAYRGAHVVVLALKKKLLPGGIYWLSINDRSVPFLAVIEHTNLVPTEEYGGRSIVYLGNYPDPNDPIMSAGDEEVLRRSVAGLQKINPDFKESWIDQSFIFKDRAAQPVVDIGYHLKIPPVKTPIPGLYLVTMAQIYPQDRGTDNAVRQAKEALAMLGLFRS